MSIEMIAEVLSNGEIKSLRMLPGQIPEEGLDEKTGNHIIYVYDDIPVVERSEWMECRYYDFANSAFVTRPARPEYFAEWNPENLRWETTQELYLMHIRQQRDFLLSQCDWTQVLDTHLTSDKKAEWAAYRTELRNITNSIIKEPSGYLTFDDTVTWPTPPE